MRKWSPTYSTKNKTGAGMVELVVAMTIISFCVAVIFGLLFGAQSSFYNSDTNIDLRNSLRLASEKITLELRNTGYKDAVAQFALLDGQGVNNTDIARFSTPILCTANGILLDANGNPANWGAPLTWGCDNSTCMDANNDCALQEYKYVQYALNDSNQLIRSVLDGNLNTVNGSTSIIGQNITDFQASLSGAQITITINGQKTSSVNKVITASYTNKILINNQGG